MKKTVPERDEITAWFVDGPLDGRKVAVRALPQIFVCSFPDTDLTFNPSGPARQITATKEMYCRERLRIGYEEGDEEFVVYVHQNCDLQKEVAYALGLVLHGSEEPLRAEMERIELFLPAWLSQNRIRLSRRLAAGYAVFCFKLSHICLANAGLNGSSK